jgi:hypothetical protein
MTVATIGKLALLWRGDREGRRQTTPDNNRWQQIFAALAGLNIHAEAADEMRDRFRQNSRRPQGQVTSHCAAHDEAITMRAMRLP